MFNIFGNKNNIMINTTEFYGISLYVVHTQTNTISTEDTHTLTHQVATLAQRYANYCYAF